VSFGIFVNIEMQTPQAFHFLKHALMKQPPFAAPAPDTLVLEDGISSNPDRFQKRCLRLTSHTGFAELCQDSQGHVSGERIELLDEVPECLRRRQWGRCARRAMGVDQNASAFPPAMLIDRPSSLGGLPTPLEVAGLRTTFPERSHARSNEWVGRNRTALVWECRGDGRLLR
jgi:hypothetical protein